MLFCTRVCVAFPLDDKATTGIKISVSTPLKIEVLESIAWQMLAKSSRFRKLVLFSLASGSSPKSLEPSMAV